jgi:hypothetical protein
MTRRYIDGTATTTGSVAVEAVWEEAAERVVVALEGGAGSEVAAVAVEEAIETSPTSTLL